MSTIKSCFVPQCPNTSTNAAIKIFIRVPNSKNRLKWFLAVGISTSTANPRVFCCEDHFDLANDSENFEAFKMTGTRLRIRSDILPHLNLLEPEVKPNVSQVGESVRKRQIDFATKFASSKPGCSKNLFFGDAVRPSEDQRETTFRNMGVQVKMPCVSVGLLARPATTSCSTQTTFRKRIIIEPTSCLVYNKRRCRICQVHGNLDLVKTDSMTDNGETYLDLLKFIFNDIFWIEDELISLACNTCLEYVTDIAKFKRLCLETNGRRGALTFDPVKVELDEVQEEEDRAVTEQADDGPEADTAPRQLAKRKLSMSDESEVFSSSDSSADSISEDYLTEEETDSSSEESLEYLTDEESGPRPKGRPKNLIELNHPCVICPQTFKTQDKLARHTFKHTGIKNLICAICGKKFVANNDLNNHERRHAKILNYACDKCPKKFHDGPNLRTHIIMVHTDKKEYKHECTECGGRFAGAYRLKAHMICHTDVRNYSCELCDKSFHYKSGLRRHVTSHSNVRAFSCDECPAEYKRRAHLREHKTKVHGIENIKDQIEEKLP